MPPPSVPGVDELPDSPWADDALAEAARIVERDGDRVRAAASANPLVGGAVRRIAIGGVIVAWMSGAVLRASPIRRRLAVHVAAIVLAAAAIAYLAVSRDRLLDLLNETWRHGPDPG